MPIAHHLDLQRKVVFTRVWGDVKTKENSAVASALAAHPDFDCMTYRQFIDMSGVRPSGEISTKGLEKLSRESTWQPSTQKRAMYTPFDLMVGLARQYAAFLPQPTGLAVFNKLDDALGHVGLNMRDYERLHHAVCTEKEPTISSIHLVHDSR